MERFPYNNLNAWYTRIVAEEKKLIEKREAGTLTNLEEARLDVMIAQNRIAAFNSTSVFCDDKSNE